MQKRKDSISGQMRYLGGRLRDWHRQSLQGLGIFTAKRKEKETSYNDEVEDMEFIEQIVKEHVDFDWEGFAKLREQSIICKKKGEAENQEVKPIYASANNPKFGANIRKKKVNKNKVAMEEMKRKNAMNKEEEDGAVQAVDDDNEDDDNDSVILTNKVVAKAKEEVKQVKDDDNDSLVELGTDRDGIDQDIVSKINGEGKEKLRFIIDFASRENLDQTPIQDEAQLQVAGIPIMEPLSSKVVRNESMALSPPEIASSLNSVSSSISHNVAENSLIIRAKAEDKKASRDGFARYKGFKDVDHMVKHFERERGFEELKLETQIELMAREAGYRPTRSERNQSVLSYLDDNYKLSDKNGENDKKKSDNADESSDSEEEVVVYSDESDLSDLDEFGEVEDDDLVNLAKQWDKVKNFNYVPEGVQPKMKIKEKKISVRRNKGSVLRDFKEWHEEQQPKPELYKRRIYDSLTVSHLKDLNFE